MSDIQMRRSVMEGYRYIPDERMEIPSKEELLPVIIRIFGENGVITMEGLRKSLKDYFWMDEEAYYYRAEDNKSYLFYLRVYNIVYHLYRHFLLERTDRGTYVLSGWGKQISESYPNIKYEEIKRLPSRDRIYVNAIEEIPYDCRREFEQNGLRDVGLEEPWYNLSEDEFWHLFKTDTRFHNIVRSGYVVYRDGRMLAVRYILGEGRYSSLELKILADENFCIAVRKNFKNNEIYFKDILYRNKSVNRMMFLTICRKPIDYDTPESEDIIEAIIREMPEDTVDILEYLKIKLSIKWNKLSQVLGISERELRYWKNPAENGLPKVEIPLKEVVAICLALQLPPNVSDMILKRVDAKDKNGFKYDPDAASGDQKVWKLLLQRHYIKTPWEINKICEKNGVDFLFSQNRDDHEDEIKKDHGVVRNDKK